MIKVSVITPTFNSEKFLSLCIDSVKNQSYKNIEYIIIDGKSTDKTLEIADQYKTDIDLLISEKDSGISDAFNKGVKLATGDLIGIINSDDYYNSDTVESVVDCYNQHQRASGIYYGNLRFFDDDMSYVSKANLNDIWKYMSLHHPAVFVTRDIYEKIGVFSEEYRYCMDAEFIHRALFNKVQFFYIDKVLANFKLEGTSGADYSKTFKEFYRSSKKYNNQGFKNDLWYYWALSKKKVSNTSIGRFFYKRKYLISFLLNGKISKS